MLPQKSQGKQGNSTSSYVTNTNPTPPRQSASLEDINSVISKRLLPDLKLGQAFQTKAEPKYVHITKSLAQGDFYQFNTNMPGNSRTKISIYFDNSKARVTYIYVWNYADVAVGGLSRLYSSIINDWGIVPTFRNTTQDYKYELSRTARGAPCILRAQAVSDSQSIQTRQGVVRFYYRKQTYDEINGSETITEGENRSGDPPYTISCHALITINTAINSTRDFEEIEIALD